MVSWWNYITCKNMHTDTHMTPTMVTPELQPQSALWTVILILINSQCKYYMNTFMPTLGMSTHKHTHIHTYAYNQTHIYI